MINKELVTDLTQAYTQSYLLSMDELHNPQLAIQVATGVTMVVGQMMQNPHRVEQNPLGVIFSAQKMKKKQATKKIQSSCCEVTVGNC